MSLKNHLGPQAAILRMRWVPAAPIVCSAAALVGCAALSLGLLLRFLANTQGFTSTQARLIYAGIVALAGACWLRPGGQLARFVGLSPASAVPPSRFRDLLAAGVQLVAWGTLLFGARKLIHNASSPRPVPAHWEIALGLAAAVLGHFHLTSRTAWMSLLRRGKRCGSWLNANAWWTDRNCDTRIVQVPLPMWSGRQLALAVAALATVPAALAVVDPGWLFAPRGIDSWVYLGFFRHYPEFQSELFPGTYYGSRLSWVLPGYLAHHLLPPVAANCALHLAVHLLAVLSPEHIAATRRIYRSSPLGTPTGPWRVTCLARGHWADSFNALNLLGAERFPRRAWERAKQSRPKTGNSRERV